MEHTLVSLNNNQQLHSNTLALHSINYLSHDELAQVPLEHVVSSHKLLAHTRRAQEFHYRVLSFNEGPSMDAYDHTSCLTKVVSSEKFLDKKVMHDLHRAKKFLTEELAFNNKSCRLYKNFTYNDDNFLNLKSSNITNYSPSTATTRFKNSNLLNVQRLEYLMWRNWAIKQFSLARASDSVSCMVSNDQCALSGEDSGEEEEEDDEDDGGCRCHNLFRLACRLKFSQCVNKMDSYLALTFADQHNVCFGPLVTDPCATKININEQVKYLYSQAPQSQPVPIARKKLADEREAVLLSSSPTDSEYSSVDTSSLFSHAASEASSVGSSVLEDPHSTHAKKPLKSCMKAKSKPLTSSTTLEEAKEIMLSYGQELNKVKHLGNGKFSKVRGGPVMFSTEATHAKIIDCTTAEFDYDAKLQKYASVEAKYSRETTDLVNAWNVFIENYEEHKIQYLYYKEMKMISIEQYDAMLKELEDDFTKKREYTKQQCNSYRKLHNKNKAKINKLKASMEASAKKGVTEKKYKLISKLKKTSSLKHGHFVEDLEGLRVQRLMHFQNQRTKLGRNNKLILLRNVIVDDDFEIYYNGLLQSYSEE